MSSEMTQAERQLYLIKTLLEEQPQYAASEIPADEPSQRLLLRGLFNIRPPRPAGSDFLAVQNAYLQEELQSKGLTDFADLTPIQPGLYLWQGDITTLRCGAIVNAANSALLGCFQPNHCCIDNAIHTYAGVQLRLACADLMRRQGREEKTGQAKITPAFNLPCRKIIHTVGPIIQGRPNAEDCRLLASCYRSCLELAEQNGLNSITFCCISTGEFHFPNDQAAAIAIQTVNDYRKQTNSKIEVIFNVFKQIDYQIYQRLLRPAEPSQGAADER